MNCMDLFVAAVAVGLGFYGAKEFLSLFMSWADRFWQNWKKPGYIFEGVFFLLILFYLSYILSSRQLF